MFKKISRIFIQCSPSNHSSFHSKSLIIKTKYPNKQHFQLQSNLFSNINKENNAELINIENNLEIEDEEYISKIETFDGYDHEIDDPNITNDWKYAHSSALDSENHPKIIDNYSRNDNIPKLTEPEIEKREKYLRRQKQLKKTEYEYMQEKRLKLEKKISEKIEDEKPIHHRIFSHIYYEPTFPDSYPPTNVETLDPTSLKVPIRWDRKRCGIIAKKVGMMSLFDKTGIQRAVTICRIDNCQVVQIKNRWNEKRGTFNIQLGYGCKKINKIKSWGELGHFVKCGVTPKEKLFEFQVGKDALLPVGTEITCRHFIAGQFVDVQGVTKGKGFQGVMKRWNFKGGPASHGSEFHRKRGATGGGMDPGRIWKGKRMPGNMGNKLHTVKSLRVFRVEPKHNLLYIAGHVPGCSSGFLKIRDAHFHPPSSPPFPTFFIDYEKEKNFEDVPEFMQWKPSRRPWWGRETNPDEWGDRVSHDLI